MRWMVRWTMRLDRRRGSRARASGDFQKDGDRLFVRGGGGLRLRARQMDQALVVSVGVEKGNGDWDRSADAADGYLSVCSTITRALLCAEIFDCVHATTALPSKLARLSPPHRLQHAPARHGGVAFMASMASMAI